VIDSTQMNKRATSLGRVSWPLRYYSRDASVMSGRVARVRVSRFWWRGSFNACINEIYCAGLLCFLSSIVNHLQSFAWLSACTCPVVHARPLSGLCSTYMQDSGCIPRMLQARCYLQETVDLWSFVCPDQSSCLLGNPIHSASTKHCQLAALQKTKARPHEHISWRTNVCSAEDICDVVYAI
jgi:hypothetical protein